jgi:hypothetical protein
MQTAPSETRIIFKHICLRSRPWARAIVNVYKHTHKPDPLLLWIDGSKAPVGVGNVDGKQNDVCFLQVLYTYRHAHTHTHTHTQARRTPQRGNYLVSDLTSLDGIADARAHNHAHEYLSQHAQTCSPALARVHPATNINPNP